MPVNTTSEVPWPFESQNSSVSEVLKVPVTAVTEGAFTGPHLQALCNVTLVPELPVASVQPQRFLLWPLEKFLRWQPHVCSVQSLRVPATSKLSVSTAPTPVLQRLLLFSQGHLYFRYPCLQVSCYDSCHDCLVLEVLVTAASEAVQMPDLVCPRGRGSCHGCSRCSCHREHLRIVRI